VTDRPPWTLWLAPAVVAVLRALPWAASLAETPTAAGVLPPIGYNPKDWLQYVAFIREAARGGWTLANPFTTAPQDGRYVQGFFELLGIVSRWTGANPFTVLELSRVPLLFLLLAACWQMTGIVLTERRHRVLACWLVMLSGGLEAVADRIIPYLPEATGWQASQDLWHLQGWNTFAAAYNPLWVAALALTLFTLVPLVRPGGPSGLRDAARLGGGLLVLGLIHPYSAIVVLVVAVARPGFGWLLEIPGAFAGLRVVAVGILPVAAVLAAITAWQNADAVYRATAGNVLGPQALSIAWYPVTLGVVGFFAVRTWRWWIAGGETGRLGLGAWTLAVVFLHASTLLNGYHFVFQLWPPLCLAAAPELMRTLARVRIQPAGLTRAVALLALVFQEPLTLTAKCIAEVQTHRIRADGLEVLNILGTLPAGNVLATADLGNYIPAYTDHRVYVGHWFLSPQYGQLAQNALAAVSGRTTPEQLAALVDAERIQYIVAPASVAPALAAALGPRMGRTLSAGSFAILVLDVPGSVALPHGPPRGELLRVNTKFAMATSTMITAATPNHGVSGCPVSPT